MRRKVAISTLQATTTDIVNTIWMNSDEQYKKDIPYVETLKDLNAVGSYFKGYPAHANRFATNLMNRIALVLINSATFNNPYRRMKKGVIELGETVEEVFTNIAKVRVLDESKAPQRELARTLPDIRTAYHLINWRVQYPVTIENDNLAKAFLTWDGVENLIADIVQQIYTAYEYDDFLLVKYMLIKGVNQGIFNVITVTDDITNVSIQTRAVSNLMSFMGRNYNEEKVLTNTPKDRQIIFMDALFNAQYDVDVLANAFNMDKATYAGALYLMDHWDEFDNDRWSEIRKECTWIEEVTAQELEAMKQVRAILLDENWFQIYVNKQKFTETYIASGDYWNYFYNVEQTISHSPFMNANVFIEAPAAAEVPTEISVVVQSKETSPIATIFTLEPQFAEPLNTRYNQVKFVQGEEETKAGIAVHTYGAYLIPVGQEAASFTPTMIVNGVTYTSGTAMTAATAVGTVLTFTKQ